MILLVLDGIELLFNKELKSDTTGDVLHGQAVIIKLKLSFSCWPDILQVHRHENMSCLCWKNVDKFVTNTEESSIHIRKYPSEGNGHAENKNYQP